MLRIDADLSPLDSRALSKLEGNYRLRPTGNGPYNLRGPCKIPNPGSLLFYGRVEARLACGHGALAPEWIRVASYSLSNPVAVKLV